MNDPVRVLLVDDLRVVRKAVERLLSVEPDVEVVGEAVDGLDAVEQVERLAPDVVVMDASMPRLNGVEATRRIREAFPQVTVVGLSMHAADYMARPMLEAGAATCLDQEHAGRDLPHRDPSGGPWREDTMSTPAGPGSITSRRGWCGSLQTERRQSRICSLTSAGQPSAAARSPVHCA